VYDSALSVKRVGDKNQKTNSQGGEHNARPNKNSSNHNSFTKVID